MTRLNEGELAAGRIEIVEILRGIAALSVAWFHFTLGGPISHPLLKLSGTYGWLGVEVFFVISGFIIPYSMWRAGYQFPGDGARFLAKRLIRLEPPYLVAVLIAVLLAYLSSIAPGFRGPPPDMTVKQIILHVGYLNPFFDVPWVNLVFWSLAIEFQFYLLMMLAFRLLANQRTGIRVAFMAIYLATAFAFPNRLFVFYFSGLFSLGLLTFWRAAGFVSNRQYLGLLALSAAVTYFTLGPAITLAGVASAVVIAFAKPRRFTLFAFLGAISYSVYLLHVPVGGRVVNLGMRFAGESLVAQFLLVATAAAVSVMAAYVLWATVEKRAQRWSKYITYVERPSQDVTASGELVKAAQTRS